MCDTISITIPENAFSLMWNGYATPYSRTGFDWMADAEYVCNRSILNERVLRLINKWIDWRGAMRPYNKYEVLPPQYIAYCKRIQYSIAYRLESQYGIVIS